MIGARFPPYTVSCLPPCVDGKLMHVACCAGAKEGKGGFARVPVVAC